MGVTETAKEAGFRVPVAMTTAAWADTVEWTETDSKRQIEQDQSGRLWDCSVDGLPRNASRWHRVAKGFPAIVLASWWAWREAPVDNPARSHRRL